MKLDREIAKKSLTDGFCSLYGEKYRNLFDSVGEEIIELGRKNGEKHFFNQALHNTETAGVWINVKFFKPNSLLNNVDELKNTILSDLSPFLSSENIEKLFTEQPYTSFQNSNFAPPSDRKNLFSKIENVLDNIKPTPIKKIAFFDYFKQFPIYDTHQKSVNLSTEGGLGLDQFHYKSVKYYLEEGEECYVSEAIPYKYHQLGSILIREEMRLNLINEIKKYISTDTDYFSKRVLSTMIKEYCFPSEEVSTLLDIQTVCGEEGFYTPKQVTERLKNYK
jgi:hypothetical protein